MGFNKATQNGRYGTATATTTRVNGVNGVNGRPTHTRSKSQAPRPRTAHAIREEQRQEPPANNGTTGLQLYYSQMRVPLPHRKTRTSQAFPTLPTTRDSSLSSRFDGLSLEDNDNPGSQAISRPLTRRLSQSSIASHISSIPCKRRGRVGQNDKITISRMASSEWA